MTDELTVTQAIISGVITLGIIARWVDEYRRTKAAKEAAELQALKTRKVVGTESEMIQARVVKSQEITMSEADSIKAHIAKVDRRIMEAAMVQSKRDDKQDALLKALCARIGVKWEEEVTVVKDPKGPK